MFNALVLEQHEKQTLANITALAESDLPDGNVTVDIDYSSLNYKDGLAITGKGKIVRQFPMVPGIDFAGTVADSQHPDYQPGDKVVLTGWGVGEGHWGGMAEKARVNGDWLVPLAEGLTEQQAMMVGTAGLTAMLCVQALIDGGVKPEDGKVLVTGASGGVGSVAVTLLHALGYRVSAVTGRLDANQTWLEQLGADDVLPRDAFSAPGRPLDKQHWLVQLIPSVVKCSPTCCHKFSMVVRSLHVALPVALTFLPPSCHLFCGMYACKEWTLSLARDHNGSPHGSHSPSCYPHATLNKRATLSPWPRRQRTPIKSSMAK